MQLVQILLPLYNKEGKPFEASVYDKIKKELTQEFGGLTAYTRSPAIGTWKTDDEKVIKDDVYVYEVMASEIDRNYWSLYKMKLQKAFQQEELIIRYSAITLL
jgi:hypothetical protein